MWQEEAGCQVEMMVNFGPTMLSFLLTLVERIWYIVGACMPLNSVAAVHQVDQSLGANTKGIENIFLGYLNAHLEEPRDEREEDLAMSLANRGLEYVRRHFTPRRRYRGQGR